MPTPDINATVYTNTPGAKLQSRDIRLWTCTMTEADSLKDLYCDVDDGYKRKNWGEMSLVGVFKGDDTAGYIPCTDQVDADVTGVLSVWDFCPGGAGSPATYEIRAGGFRADSTLAAPESEHQVYVVFAPTVPGGSYEFFDGYLDTMKGSDKVVEAPGAMNIQGVPGYPLASTIRACVFHPAGAKQEHTFRVVMHRP